MIKKFSLLGNIFVLTASVVLLLGVFAGAALLTLPDVKQLDKCITTSMYQVRLCPNADNYVPLKKISPYVAHAVIVSEDGSFYAHEGFDWHEMQASFEQNLKTGHLRRGGSTLTQQLAKNVFLSKEKSFWRKLKEAYLAHGIEKHFSKNVILEKYLNVVEFGDGIYGVKAAAHHYFQKSPSELNPLESAYLAFLLPNPKGYSKGFRSGKLTPFASKSVNMILKRMQSYGKLSPDAYTVAMSELPNFPWRGVSLESFRGTPSMDLNAPPPSTAGRQDVMDEEALEELMKETDSILEE